MGRSLSSLVLLGALTGLASLAACDGVDGFTGLGEPFRVDQATFKKGKLPGTAPSAEPDGRPRVTSVSLQGTFRPLAPGLPIDGNVTDNTYSVGMRLVDQGTGYWVVPVGAPDFSAPGELKWKARINLGPSIEPGLQEVALVAFDEEGKAGPQFTSTVCVNPDIPDNGNACDATKEPPLAVAALRWNVDADLDLVIIAPDGTRYDRTNLSQTVDDKKVVYLDHDSAAGCDLGGEHIENFVWAEKPQSGVWFIYANLFDACGKESAPYELTTYAKKPLENGQFELVEQRSVAGVFLREQSDPNNPRPLYLARIQFP